MNQSPEQPAEKDSLPRDAVLPSADSLPENPQSDMAVVSAPPARVPKSAVLALLFAIAALAAAMWLYSLTITLEKSLQKLTVAQQNTLNELPQHEVITALSAQNEALENNTSQRMGELQENIGGITQELQTLTQNVAEQRLLLQRDEQAPYLDEIEAALRLGNRRYALLQDTRGSVQALREADHMLAYLEHPELLSIRVLLNDELAAMEAATSSDSTALLLQLEGLIKRSGLLWQYQQETAEEEQQQQPATTVNSPQQGFFARWFRLTRKDRTQPPPTSTQQQQTENIRQAALSFQQLRKNLRDAQQAVLKSDDVLFQKTLGVASAVLAEQQLGDATQPIQQQLIALSKQKLQLHISSAGSTLSAFKDWRRQQQARRP